MSYQATKDSLKPFKAAYSRNLGTDPGGGGGLTFGPYHTDFEIDGYGLTFGPYHTDFEIDGYFYGNVQLLKYEVKDDTAHMTLNITKPINFIYCDFVIS